MKRCRLAVVEVSEGSDPKGLPGEILLARRCRLIKDLTGAHYHRGEEHAVRGGASHGGSWCVCAVVELAMEDPCNLSEPLAEYLSLGGIAIECELKLSGYPQK